MTQVANEVKGLKSEVLTNGGSIQRAQDREAKKEKERQEKEAEDKRAAEAHARRLKAIEERELKLAERAKAQKLATEEAERISAEQAAAKLAKDQADEKLKLEKAERKSHTANLLDDLGKTSNPSASLSQISEDIEEGEELEKLEAEPIFSPIKGEVNVPAAMSAKEEAPQAYNLGELLPAPATVTVEALSQIPTHTESAKDFINRVLNLGPTDMSPESSNQLAKEVLGDIKSKRGCERMQKIINEKRDLEKQVEDLQVTVVSLQDAIRKYEIESKLVGNVMTIAESQKKPSQLVSEAKLQMLKFLNTRSDEIDHIDKAICFNKYMSDPFYMQVFVQNNQPEQWQTMIESIYEAIGRPEPSFGGVKPITTHSPQPIRARTSTLGAPLASAGNPMDRIAQHLGNMGI